MISRQRLALLLLIVLACFYIVYFGTDDVFIEVRAQLKKYGSPVHVFCGHTSVAYSSDVVIVEDLDTFGSGDDDPDSVSTTTRFPFGSTGSVVQKQNVKRFYTKTSDLFEKVHQFNEFLKKDIAVKNFTRKSCDSVCLSSRTYQLLHGFKPLQWAKVFGNVSLLGTKAWLSQQGGSYSAISMDVMKKHNISSKQLPAPYHVFDPVSSEGPGVFTYILSSLGAENSSFIQLKTQATRFYNCTISTTMQRKTLQTSTSLSSQPVRSFQLQSCSTSCSRRHSSTALWPSPTS